VRIAVVGTGALGRHHVRILAELPEADLVAIVDLRHDRAQQLAQEHGTIALASAAELPGRVDAVVVAVPTVDHHAVTVPLLQAGLHALVEKPVAPSLEEADALVAAAGDRVLAVGHVEFYNPAVQALMALGDLPGYVEVQRMSTFTPRSLDVDVVLDLMIHDLQILHAIDPSPVREIRATGISVLSDRVDIANVRLEFESGCVANLTASRVSAERTRKLRVFLHRSYYSLDYQEQAIQGYELVEEGGARAIRRADLLVEKAEPLKAELQHFLAACRGERVPLVDGAQGRAALATALGIVSAIQARATPVSA
jgi:predicted dehydrogenase